MLFVFLYVIYVKIVGLIFFYYMGGFLLFLLQN